MMVVLWTHDSLVVLLIGFAHFVNVAVDILLLHSNDAVHGHNDNVFAMVFSITHCDRNCFTIISIIIHLACHHLMLRSLAIFGPSLLPNSRSSRLFGDAAPVHTSAEADEGCDQRRDQVLGEEGRP